MSSQSEIQEFAKILERANCHPVTDEVPGRVRFHYNGLNFVLGVESGEDITFFAVAATLYMADLDDKALLPIYRSVADQLNRQMKLAKVFTVSRDDEVNIVVAVEYYGDVSVFEKRLDLFLRTVEDTSHAFIRLVKMSLDKPTNGYLH